MNVCLIPPRELNSWERSMLARLLSCPFPGAEELRSQTNHVRVSEEYLGEDPSVIFTVDKSAAPPALMVERVPVEAETHDDDGMPILILLHVIDGFLWELELFRGDSGFIQHLPDPGSITLLKPLQP